MFESHDAGRWTAGLPAGLVSVICCSDALLRARAKGILAIGALDEPAHLATAALVLMAGQRPERLIERRREVAITLAAAVLIDLDHLPMYAGVPHVDAGGRPFTHSLSTVLSLAVLSRALPRHRRPWAKAAALGVSLHFVRDIATGPGLPVWWPVSTRSVRLPYPAYAISMAGLAALVSHSMARRASTTRGDRHLPVAGFNLD